MDKTTADLSTVPPKEPAETKLSAPDDELKEFDSEDGGLAPRAVSLLAASYRGPLPPASELRRYDEVLPGLAERIIDSWESETLHRRSLERQATSLESKLLLRGQVLAASLAAVFFGGSVYLMATGRGLEGMAVVIAEIAALVGVFVIGRRGDSQRQADSDADLHID